MLPKGVESTWTEIDQKYIMLLAWHYMHELSHALATLLAEANDIPDRLSPRKAMGFRQPGTEVAPEPYSTVTYDVHAVFTFLGERGWYLEDKLGGHLQMIDHVSLLNLIDGFG